MVQLVSPFGALGEAGYRQLLAAQRNRLAATPAIGNGGVAQANKTSTGLPPEVLRLLQAMQQNGGGTGPTATPTPAPQAGSRGATPPSSGNLVSSFLARNAPTNVPEGVDRRTDPNFDFTQLGSGILSLGLKGDDDVLRFLQNKIGKGAAQRADFENLLTNGSRFRDSALTIDQIMAANSLADLGREAGSAVLLADRYGADIERQTQKTNKFGDSLLGRLFSIAAPIAGNFIVPGIGGAVGGAIGSAATGGDFGDVLLSSALGYASGKIGPKIKETLSTGLSGAGAAGGGGVDLSSIFADVNANLGSTVQNAVGSTLLGVVDPAAVASGVANSAATQTLINNLVANTAGSLAAGGAGAASGGAPVSTPSANPANVVQGAGSTGGGLSSLLTGDNANLLLAGGTLLAGAAGGALGAGSVAPLNVNTAVGGSILDTALSDAQDDEIIALRDPYSNRPDLLGRGGSVGDRSRALLRRKQLVAA